MKLEDVILYLRKGFKVSRKSWNDDYHIHFDGEHFRDYLGKLSDLTIDADCLTCDDFYVVSGLVDGYYFSTVSEPLLRFKNNWFIWNYDSKFWQELDVFIELESTIITKYRSDISNPNHEPEEIGVNLAGEGSFDIELYKVVAGDLLRREHVVVEC